MLAIQIISTTLLVISALFGILKNNAIWDEKRAIIMTTSWGWLWRTFVIVAIWIIPLLA